jgi:hypothetical protein
MTSPAETAFVKELELFRREVEGATQFFYGYLAVNAVAGDRKTVLAALNKAPLFWKTAIASLQVSAVISLGRIFDQNSNHNVDRLLGLAQRNRRIFSKQALAARKTAQSTNAASWLADYLKKSYVPKPSDFRRLRRYIKKHRTVYESSYRDIRHKLYAHRELIDQGDIDVLFSKTRIRDLERLFIFLNQLHDALWEALFNGQRPALRARRYAVSRIRKAPRKSFQRKGVHEIIVNEVDDFFATFVP